MWCIRDKHETHMWPTYGVIVTCVWHICDVCVKHVWQKCDLCVMHLWQKCYAVWHVSDTCVMPIWYIYLWCMCAVYVMHVWRKCDAYVPQKWRYLCPKMLWMIFSRNKCSKVKYNIVIIYLSSAEPCTINCQTLVTSGESLSIFCPLSQILD